MNDATTRKQVLEQQIQELETSLSQLKQALDSAEQEEQHDAIDHLEDYLSEVDNKFSSFKQFWEILREELKALSGAASSNGK